ncbi:hypothetical protein MN116_001423 [Schistosoma mekongi]|uniref:Uncharacterized protein n=1 Tax=Schistosoma mekongi TaxID=38744 RepID=A0AAE1ZMK6_SCHME|nr:hypothetical protein MN116_001423 [Schistosoma mekongi]
MMKTVLQVPNKNIDNSSLKNIISAENAHACEVIYEIETIPNENSNGSQENSKHFRETEMVQPSVPNVLNLKHENKNPLVNNGINKNIMKQDLCNNVSRYKGKHIVDVNSSEKQLDNNKIGRQTLISTVSYNENINADNRSMDNTLNVGSKNYYSSSSSTISSLSESSTSEKYKIDSVSPEAHLSKLKKIHRKASRRKKLKYIKRLIYFLSIRILLLFALLLSIIFLLVGYLLHIRNILITGCILSLTSVGCLVQLCFTKRTSPNKFNPQSVPFALAAEDLPSTENKTVIPSLRIGKPNHSEISGINIVTATADVGNGNSNNTGNLLTVPSESSAVQTTESPNSPVVIGIDHIQARRLSMALQHLSRNSFQHQTLSSYKRETTGMLNMARRLTMASSAIAMAGTDRDYYGHSSWLTGSRVRHGVRRSLAWNESGATRFYEHCYD